MIMSDEMSLIIQGKDVIPKLKAPGQRTQILSDLTTFLRLHGTVTILEQEVKFSLSLLCLIQSQEQQHTLFFFRAGKTVVWSCFPHHFAYGMQVSDAS